MNLPVFCKVLGDVSLHDTDVGSAVLDVINSCIREEEVKFYFKMTGVDMYAHYKSLSPASRLVLEDLELLSKSEWISLSKQCEMLAVGVVYNNTTKDFYLRSTYLFGVALCMVISLFTGGAYLTTLALNDDSPDSYVLSILYDVINSYTEETDAGR